MTEPTHATSATWPPSGTVDTAETLAANTSALQALAGLLDAHATFRCTALPCNYGELGDDERLVVSGRAFDINECDILVDDYGANVVAALDVICAALGIHLEDIATTNRLFTINKEGER